MIGPILLRRSFVLQSISDAQRTPLGTIRQRRTLLTLGMMSLTGLVLETSTGSGAATAFGLGLQVPGAGFFVPWLAVDGTPIVALGLAVAGAVLVLLSMLLWFGTGNVLAPPIAWLGTAIAAGWYASGSSAALDPAVALLFASAAPAAVLISQRTRRRASLITHRSFARAAPNAGDELDLPILQLQRLLLDRALQPVDRFDGFEWRDQFQTAAVRYQLNFMSYALAVAQAQKTPAFSGYAVEAQRRLLAKQSDPRIWRYWKLESAWGRLRLTRDPVPHDNIMYTGFIATQIALAEAAAGVSISGPRGHLDYALPDRPGSAYTACDIAVLLAEQYERSRWGLLACEPGWIYPLCNLITGCGLRAIDAAAGTDHWPRIRDTFAAGLDNEFTLPDGHLVPFRSALTGLALPNAGGVVMDAFPCLFLSGLFPDRAEQHWARVRSRLAACPGPRPFWPIDVGNYRLSRASSLTASAAAAIEMGDRDSAVGMLAMLDDHCPAVLADGVRHRPRASLWSHALELLARANDTGGFAGLVGLGFQQSVEPYLSDAHYPDVLVASARARESTLALVMYPGSAAGTQTIGVAGLKPGRHYRLQGAVNGFCKADQTGSASISLVLDGRTELALTPVI